MGRLISLGDSFAAAYNEPRSYLSKLADNFNLTLHQNNPAVGASSLDHLFMQQWNSVEKDLRSGDRIVVTLTHPDRTFFFRKSHLISTLACADDTWTSRRPELGYKWNRDEKEAFKQYYTYLHSDDRNLSWLESWLYRLNSVCRDIGTVAIVMDCFGGNNSTESIDSSMHTNIKRGLGCLEPISLAEVANDATRNYLKQHADPRLNHMMLCNHQILADKIAQAWQGNVLNLQYGFRRACYDVADIYDKSWFRENVGNEIVDYDWLKKNIQ